MLKANKKQCQDDLRAGINEYLSGNPCALVKNMREDIFCGHAGDLDKMTKNNTEENSKENTESPGSGGGYFS